MPNFVERVAERSTKVRVLKLLLTLIALPFYVLGYAAGFVVVAARWIWAAAAEGFDNSRAKAQPAKGPKPVEGG